MQGDTINNDREDLALDALIASFAHISEGDKLVPLDDPAILSDEDHKALTDLGDDLVRRLLASGVGPRDGEGRGR